MWDSYIELKFSVVKILDYRNRIEELEASANPFAQVILAQLAALEKKLPEDKLASKINLVKRLYRRKWKKKDILNFLNFIDWIITLPPPLEPKYREAVKIIEEERQMKYVNTFQRLGFQEGEVALLMHQLRCKFKTVPPQYKEQIEQASPDKLLEWGEKVLKADVVEEIFEAN